MFLSYHRLVRHYLRSILAADSNRIDLLLALVHPFCLLFKKQWLGKTTLRWHFSWHYFSLLELNIRTSDPLLRNASNAFDSLGAPTRCTDATLVAPMFTVTYFTLIFYILKENLLISLQVFLTSNLPVARWSKNLCWKFGILRSFPNLPQNSSDMVDFLKKNLAKTWIFQNKNRKTKSWDLMQFCTGSRDYFARITAF